MPVKTYTTLDGLANDDVNKIVRDSRGFLWFCTGEGLSRFDGFEFKNYTQNEGLPHRNINDLLETKDGELLLATSGGLVIFNPNGAAYRWNVLTSNLEQNSDAPPMFRTFITPNPGNIPKARSVLNLSQSSDGRIFAGTGTALFQLEKTGDEWSFRPIESEIFAEGTVFSAMQFDSVGYLWLVTSTGIYRMSPDKIVKNMGGDGGGSILRDQQNQIWIGGSGTDSGLRVFSISRRRAFGAVKKNLSSSRRVTAGQFDVCACANIRRANLATVGDTLCEFLPTAAESKVKFKKISHGVFQTLAEDSGGNLWLGTTQEGVWKNVFRRLC